MQTPVAAALAAALALFPLTPALAQEFPLTIPHKFGETTIPEKPERVASVDYGGLGNLLALGVEPVIVRDWRDDFPYTAGPWAAPLLKGEPVVIDGPLDPEIVAASDPDVIIALWSGIDQSEYDQLSQIAPVVAVPDRAGDYALPWDARALIAGRAVGEEAAAARQIAEIEERLAGIRAAHPDWAEATAVVGSVVEGQFNAYTSEDVRAQFMVALGFDTPEALDEITGDAFHLMLSPETIAPYDADVIVWYGGGDRLPETLDFAARPFLAAHRDGGEIFLPDDVIAAFARVSLLSIPAVLDALEPMLVAAADGDPATEVAGDLVE